MNQPEKTPYEVFLELINKQPAYLTENWLQMLASISSERSNWKVARVLHGILHIFCEHVLIRVRVPLQDGFYRMVAADGPNGPTVSSVTNVEASTGFGGKSPYPDVELPVPQREAKAFECIPQRAILQFIGWINNVVVPVRWGDVVFGPTEPYLSTDPRVVFIYQPDIAEIGSGLPTPRFVFPEKGFCRPRPLLFALKEASRYEHVYTDRDPTLTKVNGADAYRSPPIIFHYSGWGNCAMVATRLD